MVLFAILFNLNIYGIVLGRFYSRADASVCLVVLAVFSRCFGQV